MQPLVLGDFGQVDGENAVLHFGGNLLALDVLRECESLLELHLVELAAQVFALFFVFLCGLAALHHFDDKLVVGVDTDVEVLFFSPAHRTLLCSRCRSR